MHAKNGNTHINGVNIQVCNVCRNGSAAAKVNLAKLACLPDNVVVVKQLSYSAEASEVPDFPLAPVNFVTHTP